MSAPPINEVSVALERVIRPIVEGQIRGFLKEHPSVVGAVNWYKPRADKARTFTNSLSKRIVRDLTCEKTAARLESVLLELVTDEPADAVVEVSAAPACASAGILTGRGALARERKRLILRSPSETARRAG
jgi:hypothetical protein